MKDPIVNLFFHGNSSGWQGNDAANVEDASESFSSEFDAAGYQNTGISDRFDDGTGFDGSSKCRSYGQGGQFARVYPIKPEISSYGCYQTHL